jgi:glycerol kinase
MLLLHAQATTGGAMAMGRFILSLDAGTTGVRAILFDKEATVIAQAYETIPTR